MQIQPLYEKKDEYLDIAKKDELDYELIELSSLYLNKDITQDMIDYYRETKRVKSLHGAFMDNFPLSPDLRIREVSRKRCKESCELAKRLGAENVVFHSTALTFCRGGLEKTWAKEAAAYYQELSDKYDLNIYIENFSDVDYVPMLLMMQMVDSKKVGICLDIGHVNFSRLPLNVWIDNLEPYIKYLHISDNDGQWDDHTVLGAGNADLGLASDFWKDRGGTMPVTLEVSGTERIRQSLDYLKTNGLFSM